MIIDRRETTFHRQETPLFMARVSYPRGGCIRHEVEVVLGLGGRLRYARPSAPIRDLLLALISGNFFQL